MDTFKSTIQCPNCNRWFTQQRSFKHHIRYCRHAAMERDDQIYYDTHANPLLSIGSSNSVFEGGVVSNLFQDDGNKRGSEVQEGEKFLHPW